MNQERGIVETWGGTKKVAMATNTSKIIKIPWRTTRAFILQILSLRSFFFFARLAFVLDVGNAHKNSNQPDN